MNSADVWHESNGEDNLEALLGLSVELVKTMNDAHNSELEAARERHPSGLTVEPVAVGGTILTAVDRCDAECSAAAVYRLREAKGNRVLDFCAHHNHKHSLKLAEQGWKLDGTNPSLIEELYNSNRLKGGDHA